MRKAIWAFLGIALLLLMLSALVVTPELPPVPVPPTTDVRAIFQPMLPPLMTTVSDAMPKTASTADDVPCAPMDMTVLPRLCLADANGRVITAARYENSVFLVFRPEVAGG